MRKFLILITVVLLPALAWGEPKTIRIMHMNDLHGFVQPSAGPGMKEPLGGAARVTERINQLKKEKPSLVLAAGDMVQGNSWANLTSGASVIELMNMMGFDAMTTGNHEFDFGQDMLKRLIRDASFPVLAANLTGLEGAKPYVILERGGMRIAVIGLTTTETPETTHPDNVRGLRFTDTTAKARELVKELRGRADLIVLLTHIGHGADLELAEALEIPPAGAEKDLQAGNLLIIGGHSHTRVERPVRVGTSYVAQAWEHGKALGVIDITVDSGRIIACDGRLEDMRKSDITGNAAVAALVKRYDDRLQAALGKVVGHAAVDLRQEGSRREENNLGDFVADIIRQRAGADMALLNGGAFRAEIRKGPVTLQNIYSALPFNSYIVAVRMSGRQVRDLLEHGVSAVERGEGRFPQVSGVRFTFNRSKPVGQRVRNISVAGRPLDENREYSVATLDFLAVGGDGYHTFGDAIRSGNDFSEQGGALRSTRLVYTDPGRWLRDVVAEYFSTHGEVSPVVEQRIVEEH